MPAIPNPADKKYHSRCWDDTLNSHNVADTSCSCHQRTIATVEAESKSPRALCLASQFRLLLLDPATSPSSRNSRSIKSFRNSFTLDRNSFTTR